MRYGERGELSPMQDLPVCSDCGTRLTVAQAADGSGDLCPKCSGERFAGGSVLPDGSDPESASFESLTNGGTSSGGTSSGGTSSDGTSIGSRDTGEREALIESIDSLEEVGSLEHIPTDEDSKREDPGSSRSFESDQHDHDDDNADFLDDTLTEPDTVGALETNVPEFDEDSAQSWQEGVLVADRFRLQRFIGQGGMGKVYVAQDETLKRRIALKRIPQEIIFDADARDDLRQEANRLLDLAHENIVRVHTYYDGPTWPFFAMEYLEGPTLKKLLRQRKREGRLFTAAEVDVIAKQVGRGLAHAHDHKIVHRDLKPANLMLARPPGDEICGTDTLKITDFGISRVVHDSTLQHTGKRSGTLPYMSPEQFRGDPCTPCSDVYSLACTLYELLTGSPPFVSGDIGYQIINVDAKRIDHLTTPEGEPREIECPEHFARAIERGLAKDPDDRFESVVEFLAAIDGNPPAPRSTTATEAAPAFPTSMGGFVSLASKVVAGVVLASLVLLVATEVFGPDPKSKDPNLQTNRAGPGGDALDPGGTATPVDRRKNFDDFARWLQIAVEPQLPAVIGSRHATQVNAGIQPTMNLELRFVEDDAPRGAALLSRVIFEVGRADSDGVPAMNQVPGFSENGVRHFRFVDLSEGAHVLRAYLSANGTVLGEKQKLFDHPLEVDLTPPAFELRAVDEDVLVDPEDAGSDAGGARQLFATFEESLEIRLAPTNSSGESDISKAFYQVITPDSVSSPIEIEDPRSWFIPRMTPGERKTFRVYGEDRVGHRSEERNFVFHRHRMELAEFQTGEVIANIAPVTGTFRYEGGTYPDLVFFVNGERVESEWRIVSGESADPDSRSEPFESSQPPTSAGILTSVRFEARLPLSKSINTIEVQYAWKERKARAFPTGGILEKVRMRAPAIEFSIPAATRAPEELVQNAAQRETLYTRKNNVIVTGSVEPYVPGVQLQIVLHHDFGSLQKNVVIDPAESGTTGTFSSDIELEPGVQTFIAFKCYYKGESEELVQPGPSGEAQKDTIEIYCDQEAPGGGLSFQIAGEQLVVRVQSDERALQLRGRVVPMGAGPSGAGGMLAWEAISPQPVRITPELSYSWRTKVPEDSCTIEVEITDFAGNTGLVKELFNPQVASKTPVFEPRAPRASAGALEPGTVILRSTFLREYDMRFQVCGVSRIEFATTEISEKVWFLFLDDRDFNDPDQPDGRLDHPALIEEQRMKLLPDFVEWFQDNAADGYTYFIPSEDEWLCAFAGARTAEQARRGIAAWFENEQSGFSWKQSEKYGQEQASALGSRPSNLTPTDLLDMESNVQEIVRDTKDPEAEYAVIGGFNRLKTLDALKTSCLDSRATSAAESEIAARFTGFRIARRPKGSRE